MIMSSVEIVYHNTSPAGGVRTGLTGFQSRSVAQWEAAAYYYSVVRQHQNVHYPPDHPPDLPLPGPGQDVLGGVW